MVLCLALQKGFIVRGIHGSTCTVALVRSVQVELGSGSLFLTDFLVDGLRTGYIFLWLWFRALFGRGFGAFQGLVNKGK